MAALAFFFATTANRARSRGGGGGASGCGDSSGCVDAGAGDAGAGDADEESELEDEFASVVRSGTAAAAAAADAAVGGAFDVPAQPMISTSDDGDSLTAIPHTVRSNQQRKRQQQLTICQNAANDVVCFRRVV